MIIRKSPSEIERMAESGELVARTLALIGEAIAPGVTTAELDTLAEQYIRSRGAEPTFKGYRGYPASICTSPNSMVVHGIPGPYKLVEGDVLSVDVGVTLNGFVGDGAFTFPVGETDPAARKLLETCRVGACGRSRASMAQPGKAQRHLARRAGDDRERRIFGRAHAGWPRRRSGHARRSADPQLR